MHWFLTSCNHNHKRPRYLILLMALAIHQPVHRDKHQQAHQQAEKQLHKEGGRVEHIKQPRIFDIADCSTSPTTNTAHSSDPRLDEPNHPQATHNQLP